MAFDRLGNEQLIATLMVMLLRGIVETLDAELDRLHQLRAIVSEISTPLTVELNVVDTPNAVIAAGTEQATDPAAPLQQPATKKRVAGAPRGRASARQKEAHDASALHGPIPKGPVVVNAANVAKYHAAKQVAKAVQKPAEQVGTLGSMIRALHLDRPDPR